MGDRASVALIGTQPPRSGPTAALYVYTHWNGSELPERVAQGLYDGRPRWGEPSYLGRIILCAVMGDEWDAIDGHGVGLVPFHNGTEVGRPLLVVDMRPDRQLVGFVAWGEPPKLDPHADLDYDAFIGLARWPST